MAVHVIPVASRADIAAGWNGIVAHAEPWQVALVIIAFVAMVTWFLFGLALLFGWGDRG